MKVIYYLLGFTFLIISCDNANDTLEEDVHNSGQSKINRESSSPNKNEAKEDGIKEKIMYFKHPLAQAENGVEYKVIFDGLNENLEIYYSFSGNLSDVPETISLSEIITVQGDYAMDDLDEFRDSDNQYIFVNSQSVDGEDYLLVYNPESDWYDEYSLDRSRSEILFSDLTSSDSNSGNQKNGDSNGLESEYTINGKTWMTYNLNQTKFRNGDELKYCENRDDWKEAWDNEIPAYRYGNYDSKNSAYGALYNEYAYTDPRNIAPIGWKVPSISDFRSLTESFKNQISASDPDQEKIYTKMRNHPIFKKSASLFSWSTFDANEKPDFHGLIEWWCHSETTWSQNDHGTFWLVHYENPNHFEAGVSEQGGALDGRLIKCFRE